MFVSNQDPVLQLLRQGSHKGVFPGAAICISKHGTLRYDHAVGHANLTPPSPRRNDTTSTSSDDGPPPSSALPLVAQAIFDVASLTKPVATTAAIMALIDAGELELDQTIARFLPQFETADKQHLTLRHLLCHTSGLPAHICFYEELNAMREKGEGPPHGPEAVAWVIDQIVQQELAPAPVKTVYSDLGFMTLGALVEQVTQQSLDTFCREQIFLPLGMQDTFFLPIADKALRRKRLKGRQVVATEECPWRKKILVGEVHDDNCHSMGGIAGHAGLFSTASDIHRFALTLLRSSQGQSTFFSPELVQEFWQIQALDPDSTWALGWDTPSPGKSQAGHLFSPKSVGHLGFTGCSMWIDRDDEVVMIFLSNRVHPTRDNDQIQRFRPLLHDTVRSLIKEALTLPPPRRLGAAPEPLTLEEASSMTEDANRPPLRPPPGARLSPIPKTKLQNPHGENAALVAIKTPKTEQNQGLTPQNKKPPKKQHNPYKIQKINIPPKHRPHLTPPPPSKKK